MQNTYTHGSITWIDLESPTRHEVQGIIEKYDIDPLIAEELLFPSTKPRADFFARYVYVILHFPALQHTHKTVEQEIDFVIGHDFLITTHYETIDPLHTFSKVLEVNSLLDKSTIGDQAFYLFFYMLKKLYREVEHEVDHARHNLIWVEEHLFAGQEVEMVRAISRSSSDLLNLRQTIEPHREVLKSLETDGPRFFGEKALPYLRVLSNEYYRVHNHIMRHTDSLHELRETNNSLLSTKENETMRVLTIMALLTFPLALLVSILQIDTAHNPIRGMPYDFWIILGVVFAVGSCMILYFKHRKWL